MSENYLYVNILFPGVFGHVSKKDLSFSLLFLFDSSHTLFIFVPGHFDPDNDTSISVTEKS